VWADKLLQFFRINKEITQHTKDLEHSLSIMEGRILTLQEWNKSLQEENIQLKGVIFRKFGLIPSGDYEKVEIDNKPIVMSETWRTAQAKLQKIYSKGGPLQGKIDDILAKQSEYWDKKLKAQEEERLKQEKPVEEQTNEVVAGSN
jgi:hypothetical protein